MSKENKLAFGAYITGNDAFGVSCETEWAGDDVSDEEMVAALVSFLDDIKYNDRYRELLCDAMDVQKEMMNDLIDSYTFAEQQRALWEQE